MLAALAGSALVFWGWPGANGLGRKRVANLVARWCCQGPQIWRVAGSSIGQLCW